ncbi:MAG: transposase, partial [Pseudomonadota bacterium]
RNWSDDEKRMICGQTRIAGVSVSQVARRYDVNANLVFTWLRDPRFAGSVIAEESPRFLPVEVVEDAMSEPAETPAATRIEIDLVGGHRLRISGRYDPDALARLIRGLSG